jgi:hypothetical protein
MSNKSMSVSDFNLERLSTKDLSVHIAAAIQVGSNIAVFGRRGTGKTEIAKYEIKKADLCEVYINLSVLERVDMGGYPNILAANQNKKFVDFLLPQFYEQMIEGKKGVVALLDEVDKADVSLWAPLLEFTQFRSINSRKLPQLKAIIMTGNLISEGGSRPSLPLLDRSEKYLVEADATSWLEWSGKTGGIHPSITSYIADHPEDLFGSTDIEDRYADPSPRGWTRASELLFKGEELSWSTAVLNKKVSGCIGKSTGIKYSNYYEHYQELLPLVDDIFAGKNICKKYESLEPTKKLITCMITCARLTNKLDTLYESRKSEKDYPTFLKFVGKFMQDVSHEIFFVTARSQIQLDRLAKWNIDEHPDWKDLIFKITKKMPNCS